MDWILDNIWVLVAISAVIARLLMKRKEGDAAQRGQPAPPRESETEDPALAERTRKIREEIQRKIAERRGQRAQPPVLQPLPPRPVPAERDSEDTASPLTLRDVVREVMHPQTEQELLASRQIKEIAVAAEARRQADVAAKLQEAELVKTATRRRAALEATMAEKKESAAIPPARAAVLDDLRSPPALRRAFVLREVLGPPVALR